jgi:subtilisin family serine protease
MIDDDANPQEEGPGVGWGHGTHVAGIIAHIAPQSKLLPIRVLDAEGRGNTFTLAYAIEWAVKRGAKIINLSLGTTFDSRVLSQVIEEAVDQGVIIVAAAGNNNQPNRQYPVGYPDVIGVTAVDSRNHKASFANYGVWIDFAAPGVGITSTIIGAQGSGYASWSGTSMSTAFLSGALTLAREKWPTRTPDELLQALQEGGGDLNSSNPTHAGKLGRMLNISAPLVADLPSTETPTQTPDFTPTVTPTPTVTEQPVETGTPEATITPTPSSTAPPATPSPTEPPSTNLTNRVYLPITLR